MDWTYVVVRTQAGHEATQKLLKTGIIETMEVPEKAKKLLARLSKRKPEKPQPAELPSLEERLESGDLDPKNFQGDANGKGK